MTAMTAPKGLSVLLNLVWMVALYLVLDFFKDWFGSLLVTQLNLADSLLSSLPILILSLVGLYLFSRWREKNMSLGTIEETIQNIKIDGALLSIVLALSLWCRCATGTLNFDQVFNLAAILSPYLIGQLRGNRLQRDFVRLVQESQQVLEKLVNSGLKQISVNTLLGTLELDKAWNPAMMQEFAERRLKTFSQDLAQQGYDVEMRLNKMTKEPILIIEKVIRQARGKQS